MSTFNNQLEPVAIVDIACEFAGDIHCANDLWYTLKESQNVGSATTIDRFDLESFIGHMLNINNNGQLHQQLLLADAEPASIDPCHKSLILKFVNLLDGAGYNVEKMSDDGLALLLLKQLSDAESDGDPIEANYLLKSNLGHTESAADVASLIKVAMCMYHGGITTNMQFTSLNPKIDAQKYNLHILQNFVSFPTLPNNDKIAIAIFVFLNRQQLQEQINAFLTEQPLPGLSIISRPTKSLAQKICFIFSGQGPQWWAMGRQLYESEPLFNEWINLIDGEMTKINNNEWRLLEELNEKKNEQESRINDTNIAQPTLFAIQVALAALLVSWNIYPSSIIPHSAGDQAAAFVAGRLTLEEAVRIEHLACIAVVNSPRSVTISGDEKTIDEIQQ
ncbi:unnamed protein product, partial [Adineta steineri]